MASKKIERNGKIYEKSMFYPAGQTGLWPEHKKMFYSGADYVRHNEQIEVHEDGGLAIYSRYRNENGTPIGVSDLWGTKKRKRR